jgi:hypothetical protein
MENTNFGATHFVALMALIRATKPGQLGSELVCQATDRAAVASSSNAVEMSRMLMTPIRV